MFFAWKTTCAGLPSMCNNKMVELEESIKASPKYAGLYSKALKDYKGLCCSPGSRLWNTCGSHWWSIFEKTSKQPCDRQSLRQNNEEKLGVKPSLDHVSKIEDDNEFQSHVKKSDDDIETVNGERRMAKGEWRTADGKFLGAVQDSQERNKPKVKDSDRKRSDVEPREGTNE